MSAILKTKVNSLFQRGCSIEVLSDFSLSFLTFLFFGVVAFLALH